MSETSRAPGGVAADEPERHHSTGEFVVWQASRLQAAYTHRPQAPWARAALAQLRRGLGRGVGEIPEILELTVNPAAQRPRSDEATADEIAIHVALTMFGLHQQSQSAPMHLARTSFASAVGSLRFADGAERPGVLRRFQALGTASDLTELVHHARGLVPMLRAAGRGFDYGRFAEDLVDFQSPRRVDRVRLAWGRDFYRVVRPDQTTPATSTEEL